MNSGSLTPSVYAEAQCYATLHPRICRYLQGATYIPGTTLGTGGAIQSPCSRGASLLSLSCALLGAYCPQPWAHQIRRMGS